MFNFFLGLWAIDKMLLAQQAQHPTVIVVQVPAPVVPVEAPPVLEEREVPEIHTRFGNLN